nr:unnamed protein product [Callosobruchus chinensis]
MKYREEQFDSSVTRPSLATSSRFLTGVLLVTSHSSTGIQTDSAPLRFRRSPSVLDAPAELLLTPRRSFFIHQQPNDTTAPLPPGCPGPGMGCLMIHLLSRRVLAYSSLASTNVP